MPDVPGHDGVTPLHVAAMRGDLASFVWLQERPGCAQAPQVQQHVEWSLEGAADPGGGVTPVIALPRGATPLFAARQAQARYEELLGLYRALPIDHQSRRREEERVAAAVQGTAAITRRLEDQGVRDETRLQLPEELAFIVAECSRLAKALGVAGFDARAARLGGLGAGPFGIFLECAQLLRPGLTEAARARLEQTLCGRFVTGSLERRLVFDDPADPLDEPDDPAVLRLRLEKYPLEVQARLRTASHYGLDGQAILSVEKVDGSTRLFSSSPERVTDLGPFSS
jgi:hypothetical protein